MSLVSDLEDFQGQPFDLSNGANGGLLLCTIFVNLT